MTPIEIRNFRKRLNLTQAQFGTVIGSSTRAVEDWERGVSKPPRMLRLALVAVVDGYTAESAMAYWLDRNGLHE